MASASPTSNSSTGESAESTVPVKFPSDYFRENGALPPSINLIKFSGTFAQLEGYVRGRINGGQTIELPIASRFIWECMAKLEGVLLEDWTSYGVELGKTGATVTPQALLTLTETEGCIPELGNVGTDGTDWKWMLMLLVAPYRLNTRQKQNHSAAAREYNNTVTSLRGGIRTSASSFSSKYFIWSRDPNYEKLIAALDMFLFQFTKHEMSELRMGTIDARKKDCAMLDEVRLLCEKLRATDFNTLFKWVWIPEVRNELRRMFASNEEINQSHSYLPYLASMQLCPTSPYSARCCPNLYTFSNVLRALDMEKIQNVQISTLSPSTDIINNVIVLAYVHGQFRIQFGTLNVFEEDRQRHKAMFDHPYDDSPDEWNDYIRARNGNIPDYITEFVANRWTKWILETREGTLGAYLKEQGRALLKNPKVQIQLMLERS